ncbi:MAG TPA: hypothetical protein PKE06_04525 [Flavilitoribacter sp.]|nr:hypothetical protein [Flavilitoribacter sp.]HMQ87396.1 hypothetical protein [Flavilitoribacter sp.]
MRLFKAIALVMLVALLFQACRKDLIPAPDSQHDLLLEKIESAKATLSVKEKPFFEPDFAEYNNPHVEQKLGFRTNPDSLITEVLETVLLQNKEEQFVTDLIDNLGYPFWSRGEVYPVVNDPTHNLTAIPMARLDEDFTSAILFSVIDAEAPYFFLVEREELLTFLDVVKVQDKENARFLVAEMLYFDFELFGTKDSLFYTGFNALESNALDEDEKLSFRCGTIEVEYNKCIPVYAFTSDPSGSLEFRNCPPGTKEVTITLTAVIPCSTPDLSFPVDNSSTFPGGNTDWWISGGGGSHGNTSSSTQPISNATLNGLNISTLQEFFDACNAQGEPGIPSIPGGLCDQIRAVTAIIPAGSAELAWLLGDGAINQDLLNFFANWAPTHDLPANAEFAAGIIQLYATGKIDASKGFNAFDFTRAANLMAQLGLSFEQGLFLYNNPSIAIKINALLSSHPSDDGKQAARSFIEIAQFGPLSQALLFDFIDALDELLDDYSSGEEAFLEFIEENNINLAAVSPGEILFDEPIPEFPSSDGIPLTPAKFWQLADGIRADLISRYPTQADKIIGFFACRVLGIALERAALNSLGIPHYNTSLPGYIPGSGVYDARPDGLFNSFIIDYGGGLDLFHSYPQPVVVEIKGVFSSSATFDYSGNPAQFNRYLDFLQENQYTSGTISHALYLILPEEVPVADGVIDAATDQHVPLVISRVELDPNDNSKMRVKSPEFQNFSALLRNDHLLRFLPTWAFENNFRRLYRRLLNFDYVTIDFQQAANEFEASYLMTNQNPSCPED